MKVFLSHNSKDKWLARRISKDLTDLGAETFLDEKDISTGVSIDDTIQKHLGECDDFLVLLSPSSLESDWVLIELGGAIALSKRLVPILLYIDANEIPKPITKHLARDISDIERYYDEVKLSLESFAVQSPIVDTISRNGNTKKNRKKKPCAANPHPYSTGNSVLISKTRQPDAKRIGININWQPEMDRYCGKKTEITAVDDDLCYNLDIDGGESWWAHEWLELL